MRPCLSLPPLTTRIDTVVAVACCCGLRLLLFKKLLLLSRFLIHLCACHLLLQADGKAVGNVVPAPQRLRSPTAPSSQPAAFAPSPPADPADVEPAPGKDVERRRERHTLPGEVRITVPKASHASGLSRPKSCAAMHVALRCILDAHQMWLLTD